MAWFNSRKVFLIISPEGWGSNMLSKHHYAVELAKLGHKIFFLNPPGKAKLKNNLSNNSNIEIINHLSFRGQSRMPERMIRFFQKIEIWLLLFKMKGRPNVVWSFDPYRLQYLKSFKSDILIYHAIDNHFTSREMIIEQQADIVLSNAQFILNKIKNPNKYLVGHGVASHFFLKEKKILGLPGSNLLSVGYVGNLNNSLIDFTVFGQLIPKYPKIDFYFVGPMGDSNISSQNKTSKLREIIDLNKNSFWLGEKDSIHLPNYLKSFDILLLLYKADRSGFIVNPHKLLEYLSSGNIVIATLNENILPELNNLITRIKDSTELEDAFEYVLKEYTELSSDVNRALRREFAFLNSYKIRVEEIFDIIEFTYEKKNAGGFDCDAT